MGALFGDLRYSVRSLARDHAFTLVAVLTLTVCLGANVAVFVVVNSVLLRPLPVPEADRIVLMSNQYPKTEPRRATTSMAADYFDRLERMTVFDEQAMFVTVPRILELDNVPQRVQMLGTTASLFRILRASPAVGRVFTDEDADEASLGRRRVVVLSYGLWQRLYGGRPDIVGRELRVNGRPHTVLGAMARDFVFVDPEIQAWVPLTFSEDDKQRRHYGPGFTNIGRLKPGATLEQAQAQLQAIDTANLERYPESRETLIAAGFHSAVEPFKDSLVRDVRTSLFLLWGGAGFVLLIGTVNVGNLALARSRRRSRELAMRLTVGASRARLIRQLVTENLLVACISGLLGLLLSAWLVAGFDYVGVDRLPRASEIRFDNLVVAFVLSAGTFVGLLLGMLPAAYSLRVDPMETLRDDTRSVAGGRGFRMTRSFLVVGQFALAFVLLTGAGLLLASFRQLLAVNPGFVPQGVVTFATDLPAARYGRNDLKRSFVARTEAALRSIHGVDGVGATNTLPFDGFSMGMVPVAEGHATAAELVINTNWRTVTPGFFDAMRIPFVRGRNFDDRDDVRATRVTIIDEQMAARLWPGPDPIGRRIYVPTDVDDSPERNDPSHWLTVIGVVRSARFEDLAGDATFGGAYYTPFAQEPIRDPAVLAPWAKFVVKAGDLDTGVLMRAVRAEIAKIDPQLALYDVRTMTEQYDLSLASRRIGMRLAVALASVALFLAVVGIYGVLSYVVAERTRELGIRAALGATLANIFRLVLNEAILLVLAGVIVGLIGTVALRGGIARYLYGVGPVDPLVIGGVAAALAGVALGACAIPARRATRVDPVEVLRQV